MAAHSPIAGDPDSSLGERLREIESPLRSEEGDCGSGPSRMVRDGFDVAKRTEVSAGLTHRKQLTGVVILIFKPFNDPLIERDQDDPRSTWLSTNDKTS